MPPEELAGLIGLGPDETWKKGDPRRLGRLHRFNGINYASGLNDRDSPSDHVAALVDRLRPYAEQIATVAVLPTTRGTRISVVEHTLRDNVHSGVSSADVAAIAQMGAELFVDVYFYEDEA